jgi:hypothetical protein
MEFLFYWCDCSDSLSQEVGNARCQALAARRSQPAHSAVAQGRLCAWDPSPLRPFRTGGSPAGAALMMRRLSKPVCYTKIQNYAEISRHQTTRGPRAREENAGICPLVPGTGRAGCEPCSSPCGRLLLIGRRDRFPRIRPFIPMLPSVRLEGSEKVTFRRFALAQEHGGSYYETRSRWESR